MGSQLLESLVAKDRHGWGAPIFPEDLLLGFKVQGSAWSPDSTPPTLVDDYPLRGPNQALTAGFQGRDDLSRCLALEGHSGGWEEFG